MNTKNLSVVSIEGQPPIGMYEAGSSTVLFNLPDLSSINRLGTDKLFPREARGVSSVAAEAIKVQVEAKLGRSLGQRELVVVHFGQNSTGLVHAMEQNVWDFNPEFFSQRLDGPLMAVEELMDRLMLRNSRVQRSETPMLPEKQIGDFGRILGMRGDADYVGMLSIGRANFPLQSSDDLRNLASKDAYQPLGLDMYEFRAGTCRVNLTEAEVKEMTSAASEALGDFLVQADATNSIQSLAGANRLMTDLERFTIAATQVNLARQADAPVPIKGLPKEDVTLKAMEGLGHIMTLAGVGQLILQTPGFAAVTMTTGLAVVAGHSAYEKHKRSRGETQ